MTSRASNKDVADAPAAPPRGKPGAPPAGVPPTSATSHDAAAGRPADHRAVVPPAGARPLRARVAVAVVAAAAGAACIIGAATLGGRVDTIAAWAAAIPVMAVGGTLLLGAPLSLVWDGGARGRRGGCEEAGVP